MSLGEIRNIHKFCSICVYWGFTASQPNGVMLSGSVYLTTLLFGRLSRLSSVPVLCTFFRQKKFGQRKHLIWTYAVSYQVNDPILTYRDDTLVYNTVQSRVLTRILIVFYRFTRPWTLMMAVQENKLGCTMQKHVFWHMMTVMAQISLHIYSLIKSSLYANRITG